MQCTGHLLLRISWLTCCKVKSPIFGGMLPLTFNEVRVPILTLTSAPAEFQHTEQVATAERAHEWNPITIDLNF